MPELFGKFIFEFEAFSYLRIGLSLAKQLMSPQKMLSILIFGSPVCTPLIPCNYCWNGWRTWLEQHTETWKADSHAELPTWWGWRTQRGDHFLYLRWNIVLHDSYQTDEIVTEIEEWKQKVIKCVGNCIILYLKFDHSWLLNLQLWVWDF